jgi:nucleotide-binding universal stress UspA family protein
MREPPAPRPIVVGADGSRPALQAALWAVDEAVSRDVPLRLLCAVDSTDEHGDAEWAARKLATPEIAAQNAVMAVEATRKPVKIEVEIVQDRPIGALIRASRPAAMICLGAVGFHHFQPGRVGSTAAAVAASAHCPVAIIRGNDHAPNRREQGWIVVEVDNSPHTGVLLQAAIDEARLRNAPLRVITCWHCEASDIRTGRRVADANHRVEAELDRRLTQWTRHYPDVDVQTAAIHGSIVDYLTDNASSVQLIVVGAHDRRTVQQLVGPTGNAALHRSDCSVLIVDHQHL